MRDVRRFNVWDHSGRLFVLIESEWDADDIPDGCPQLAATTFRTLNGAEAVADNVKGSYRIPSCGVTVSEMPVAH